MLSTTKQALIKDLFCADTPFKNDEDNALSRCFLLQGGYRMKQLTSLMASSFKVATLSAILMASLVSAPLVAEAQSFFDSNDFSQAQTATQLQTLVAPIALYPDPLIAQILQAATYPDQVQQAAISIQSNPRPVAFDSPTWDPSVVAVSHYPPVIQMMSNQISWTTQLGKAYLSQQGQVFQAIQAMRAKAKAMGNLKTTAQQQVVQSGDAISIYPVTDTMYVPMYDPVVVYNTAPTWGAAPLIGFGTGWAIGSAMAYSTVDWYGGTVVNYPPGAGWRTAYTNGNVHGVAGETWNGTDYAGREGSTTLANGADVKGYQGAAVGPYGAAAGRGWSYSNNGNDAGGFSRTVDTANGVYNVHGAGASGADGSDGYVTATHINDQGQVSSDTVTDRDGDVSSDVRSDTAFSEARDDDFHPDYADRGAWSRGGYGGDDFGARRMGGFGGGGFRR